MTSPTQSSSLSSKDWQLVADTFKVMRVYQCSDDEPGLTAKDVSFLKQNNPKLFSRVVQGISSQQPKDVTAESFLPLLERVKSEKMLPLLTKLAKDIFPNTVSSYTEPAFEDRFYLVTFSIKLDKSHEGQRSDYDKLKNAIQMTLTKHGVSLAGIQLAVGYPAHHPGKEKGARFWVTVDFHAGVCAKPTPNAPNS